MGEIKEELEKAKEDEVTKRLIEMSPILKDGVLYWNDKADKYYEMSYGEDGSKFAWLKIPNSSCFEGYVIDPTGRIINELYD